MLQNTLRKLDSKWVVLTLCIVFFLSATGVAMAAAPYANRMQVTENEAETIALNQAGLLRSEVSFLKTANYDKEGNIIYAVEFQAHEMRYSYEVNAVSGEIMTHYINRVGEKKKNKSIDKKADSSQYIGQSKAQQIAVAHASADMKTLKKYDNKLDKEDGIMVYEVEFVSGNKEYEYIIDAMTGEILHWEVEKD